MHYEVFAIAPNENADEAEGKNASENPVTSGDVFHSVEVAKVGGARGAKYCQWSWKTPSFKLFSMYLVKQERAFFVHEICRPKCQVQVAIFESLL
jgi:hypothetical protein